MADAETTHAEAPFSCPLVRRDCSVRERRTLPSRLASIGEGVETILDAAERCGLNEDQRFDLEVAAREALSNAVVHGNEEDAAKRVFLRCYGAPGAGLLILIRDQGPGFAPDSVPDPTRAEHTARSHGRGVFLMEQLLERLEFRRNGTEALLYKAC